MELNEEGLVIKPKKVDSRTKALIDRILMPYPVAAASYAFAKAMVKQNVTKVANYFGYQQNGKDINTTGLNPELAKTFSQLSARQAADGSRAAGSSAAATSSRSASEPDTSLTPKSTADGKSEPPKDGRPLAKENIPYYSELVGKASGPWAAFRERYRRAWKPLRYYPPRGSLAVHGMVALDSPRGRIFIDVFAWYHPKTDQFHQDSLTMNLRSISPYNQHPRR